MNKPLILTIFRWLLWLLLITFESVVGFPWLSLVVVGQWLLVGSTYQVLGSIVLSSLILAATYSLAWPLAMLAVMILWQVNQQTRKHSSQRWLIYLSVVVVIGWLAGTPLNGLSLVFTFFSWLFYARWWGIWGRNLWQKLGKVSAKS